MSRWTASRRCPRARRNSDEMRAVERDLRHECKPRTRAGSRLSLEAQPLPSILGIVPFDSRHARRHDAQPHRLMLLNDVGHRGRGELIAKGRRSQFGRRGRRWADSVARCHQWQVLARLGRLTEVTARIDSLGLGDHSVDPCEVAMAAAEVIAQRPVDRRTAIVSLAAVRAAAGCSGEVTRGRPRSAATARPVTHGPAIARSSGPDIVHGPRTRQEVALTFHGAGDRSLTGQILRDCADHDARITVFAVGQWLSGTPSLGPQILEDGHELAHHTWSHRQMPALSAQAAQGIPSATDHPPNSEVSRV